MATVRTRKRGKTYSYIFEAGRTIDGKRKVIEKGGYPTKQDAYDAGMKVYNSYTHGGIVFSNKIKLCDYLPQWLDKKQSSIRPLTLRQYRSGIKRVIAVIGDMYVQDVRPRNIVDLFDSFYKDGLSRGSIRFMRAMLSSAFHYAVYPAELIASNPVSNIPIPRLAPDAIVKREVISHERYLDIMDSVAKSRCKYARIPLAIMYHTGMRIGEVLGLTWDCVNLSTGMITVKQQLIHISRGYNVAPPKTQSSVRTFYIDNALLNLLREWNARQKANEDIQGDSYQVVYVSPNTGETKNGSRSLMDKYANWTKMDFVCTNDNGRPIHHDTIKTVLKRCGCNAHSFRHTHATQLIELGARAKDVAARLGHKSVMITEDLYTHETDGMKRDTVNIINRAISADNMQTNA